MSDHHNSDDIAGSRDGNRGVRFDGLSLPEMADVVDLDLLEDLYRVASDGDRQNVTDLVRSMLAKDISADDIADHYIPTASKIMGEAWCQDLKSFAQVTIGASRLQSALRLLGPDWSGDDFAEPHASTVLLLVGRDIYHTLGSSVLAGQLRRKGLSVRHSLGVAPSDLAALFATTAYDAVFVSASCGDSLESLRLIVEAARAQARPETKIVVGGTILLSNDDTCALTGADYVTMNADEAISFCGLKTKFHQTQSAGK